jgi:flagellar hook-length control protein FliK
VKTTATPTTLSAAPPAPTAASPVSPLAAVATATALDRAPEQNAAGARRFAELLRARRSETVAPTPPAAPRSAAASADPASKPEATTEADAAEHAVETSASTSSRTAAGANPAPPSAKRATAKAAVDTAPEHAASDVEARRDQPDTPTLAASTSTADRSPTLALLAGQQPAATVAATTRDDTTDVDARANRGVELADDPTLTSDGQRPATGAFGAHGKAAVDTTDERVFAAASGHAQPTDVHAEATFASALGDLVRAADPATTRTARSADAAPIVASSVAGAPAEVRDAAPPATPLALATPIDSPDFAAALGVQVSVLARDGVQQAELHLHPVETGPVSIRIEVDGTNARIDFGADLAATRHAIEQGLPELASALRDAGLTLAGGGVSQHAGSRPRSDADGSDAAARTQAPVAATSPAAAPARAVPRRIAAGGVDLYA